MRTEKEVLKMSSPQGFSLSAHFLDGRRKVSASFDGVSWSIVTDDGQVSARGLNQAIRVSYQYVGQLLFRVGRRSGWGLRVEAASVSASYDHPDLLEPVFPGGGGRGDPNSLVARIRSRWRNGDIPESALDDALEIVRAYLGRAGSRRAA